MAVTESNRKLEQGPSVGIATITLTDDTGSASTAWSTGLAAIYGVSLVAGDGTTAAAAVDAPYATIAGGTVTVTTGAAASVVHCTAIGLLA